jgi:hypothetical protein
VTTTIDPTILDSIEAAPVPYDFYREVHKGLRRSLFDLTAFVGSAACEDADERAEIARRVHGLVAVFHSHHAHEDDFIQPLLKGHAPELAAEIDAGHHDIDEDLADLEQLADALTSLEGGTAVAAGLELYRTLASFIVTYLAHMEIEEGPVMTTLRDAMSTAELFEIDMALRASIAPPKMCEFITVMVPAMNADERTNMLGGMRAGAPAEIFELFRATAEAALTPAAYGTVATRLGLA